MNDATKTRSPSLRRRFRLAARCACAAVGLWVVWLAATRWNGVPAATPERTEDGALLVMPLDPALDRTAELRKALIALPPLPAMTLPPPPSGMKWSGRTRLGVVSPLDALDGDWTPETRPHLASIIAHLDLPAVEQAFADLSQIAPGECVFEGMSHLADAVKLLLARARYRHSGLGDVDAAINDCQTAIRLSALASRSKDLWASLGVMIAQGLDRYVVEEMRLLIHERKLSRLQLDRILSLARDELPEGRWYWMRIVGVVRESTLHSLDLYYTDSDSGQGWLVLNRIEGMSESALWYTGTQRGIGAWNVLSVVFNDRRTVQQKMERLVGVMERAADAPYADAQAMLEQLDNRSELNVLDGPFWYSSGTYWAALHQRMTRYSAVRRALIATAALALYRLDHGRFPQHLSELKGDYLARIPLDPYDDQPMRYALDDSGSRYDLWVIGPDRHDDFTVRRHDPSGQATTESDDVVFADQRKEPTSEPSLETIQP